MKKIFLSLKLLTILGSFGTTINTLHAMNHSYNYNYNKDLNNIDDIDISLALEEGEFAISDIFRNELASHLFIDNNNCDFDADFDKSFKTLLDSSTHDKPEYNFNNSYYLDSILAENINKVKTSPISNNQALNNQENLNKQKNIDKQENNKTLTIFDKQEDIIPMKDKDFMHLLDSIPGKESEAELTDYYAKLLLVNQSSEPFNPFVSPHRDQNENQPIRSKLPLFSSNLIEALAELEAYEAASSSDNNQSSLNKNRVDTQISTNKQSSKGPYAHQYVCEFCRKPYFHYSSLARHVRKNHRELYTTNPLKFQCDIDTCTEGFDTQRSLTEHKKNTHPDHCNLLFCKLCTSKSYSHHRSLNKHIHDKHYDTRYPDYLFECTRCMRSFATRRSLIVHQSSGSHK